MKGDAIGAVWRSKRGKDLPTIAILRRDPASKMVTGVTADRTELRIPRDQLKAEWVFVASPQSWFVNEETAAELIERMTEQAQTATDLKGGRL